MGYALNVSDVSRARRLVDAIVKRVIRLGGVALAEVFLILFGWASLQVYQITHPQRVMSALNPKDFGLDFERVEFTATDGIVIAGWWIPGRNDAVVIIVHGHGGEKSSMLGVAHFLNQAGYPVLLFDLRAHGESGGDLASLGYHEQKDLTAAVRYAASRSNPKIGVLGVSLGASIALLTAVREPGIRAVVADSPFASLFRQVQDTYKGIWGKVLQAPLILAGRVMTGIWPWDIDPHRYVAQLAPRPLFLIAGDSDSVIKPENSRLLYEEAGSPKELWLAPGADHAGAFGLYPQEYRERVLSFFQRWLLEK